MPKQSVSLKRRKTRTTCYTLEEIAEKAGFFIGYLPCGTLHRPGWILRGVVVAEKRPFDLKMIQRMQMRG